MRSLYVMGGLYSLLCGAVAWRALSPKAAPVGAEPPTPVQIFTGGAGDWFQGTKPFCNALEVESRMKQLPPPEGADGGGYGAACFALAGRIPQARALIVALPAGERSAAASIVFNIGHPVADAGDDRSAGPIMELVLEFTPDNYMALYHAGMSEYVLGQPERAAVNLHRFLELYRSPDGWRQNALEVLSRMEGPER